MSWDKSGQRYYLEVNLIHSYICCTRKIFRWMEECFNSYADSTAIYNNDRDTRKYGVNAAYHFRINNFNGDLKMEFVGQARS